MKAIISIFLLSLLNLSANSMGSLLFHGNCTTCHFETKSVSAPSVMEFKKRYITAFPKKEDFVKHMSTWIQHPKKETSIMLDAIEKYKLMPELGFDIDTLKMITGYIYDTDFKEHNKIHTFQR